MTTKKQELGLLTLAGFALLSAGGPLGTDMYLPALPLISKDLSTTPAMTQLSITAYMIGMALGQVVIGPLSDGKGRRGLLIGGMALGLVASLVCATAPSIAVLIAARLFQGVAGGTGVVLTRAMIADRLRGSAAARAFSVMMLIIGVAPILAPLLGGVINHATSWRGIFWTLAVIALAQIAVSLSLPETLPAERRNEGGPMRMYRNMLGLFRRPAFLGYAVAFAFGFGVMFAFISGSSFVYQDVFGLSPVAFSVMFAMNAVALMLANSVNIRVVARVGTRRMQRTAMILIAVGAVAVLLCALFLPRDASGAMYVMAVAVFVATFGVGLNTSNATALAQELTAGRAGAGSALLGAGQFVVAGVMSPLVGLGSDRLLAMAVCMVASVAVAIAGTVVASKLHPAEAEAE